MSHYDQVQEILKEADVIQKCFDEGIPSEEILIPFADYITVCCLLEGKRQKAGSHILEDVIEHMKASLKNYQNGNFWDDFYNIEEN